MANIQNVKYKLINFEQVKDGKFSVEGSVKLAEMSGDPNKPQNVINIGTACESVTGADRYVAFYFFFIFYKIKVNFFI